MESTLLRSYGQLLAESVAWRQAGTITVATFLDECFIDNAMSRILIVKLEKHLSIHASRARLVNPFLVNKRFLCSVISGHFDFAGYHAVGA